MVQLLEIPKKKNEAQLSHPASSIYGEKCEMSFEGCKKKEERLQTNYVNL